MPQIDLALVSAGLSEIFRCGSGFNYTLAIRYSWDKSRTQVCARKDSLSLLLSCLSWEALKRPWVISDHLTVLGGRMLQIIGLEGTESVWRRI